MFIDATCMECISLPPGSAPIVADLHIMVYNEFGISFTSACCTMPDPAGRLPDGWGRSMTSLPNRARSAYVYVW